MTMRDGDDSAGGDAGIARLGYALLGLIRAEPRSGYALRKVFETTPLSAYSSSPGSIYPALKSLTKGGLVALAAGRGKGQVYALTDEGLAALRRWLLRPVAEEEVARHLDLALLRFAFLQDERDPAAVAAFLGSFEAAARAHAASLDAFLGAGDGAAMSLHSKIAVEHGLRTILASAEWAADARRRLAGPHSERETTR